MQQNRQEQGIVGLGHGLAHLGHMHRNLTVPELYEHAIRNGEGQRGDTPSDMPT